MQVYFVCWMFKIIHLKFCKFFFLGFGLIHKALKSSPCSKMQYTNQERSEKCSKVYARQISCTTLSEKLRWVKQNSIILFAICGLSSFQNGITVPSGQLLVSFLWIWGSAYTQQIPGNLNSTVLWSSNSVVILYECTLII